MRTALREMSCDRVKSVIIAAGRSGWGPIVGGAASSASAGAKTHTFARSCWTGTQSIAAAGCWAWSRRLWSRTALWDENCRPAGTELYDAKPDYDFLGDAQLSRTTSLLPV